MILSLLATVAVLAALVVIAAALALAEPTLVYIALGLGGLSVLLLLGALVQGRRFGGSGSDTARTDGLGKSSVPVVAASTAVGTVPGTQWEPEHSGRVPAPAQQPVRESAVTEPPVSPGHEVDASRVTSAEENEEEAEFEVPRWQTPTMGSWPDPAVGPDAAPKPEEDSEKTETVPEPDGSDETPQEGETPARETPAREALHEDAPDPTEVEAAPEPVVAEEHPREAVAEAEPATEPEREAVEETAVNETSAGEAASPPVSDDDARAEEQVREDRAPVEDEEAAVAYAALLDTRDEDVEPDPNTPVDETDATPERPHEDGADPVHEESDEARAEAADSPEESTAVPGTSDEAEPVHAESEEELPEISHEVDVEVSRTVSGEGVRAEEPDTRTGARHEDEGEPVREESDEVRAEVTDAPEESTAVPGASDEAEDAPAADTRVDESDTEPAALHEDGAEPVGEGSDKDTRAEEPEKAAAAEPTEVSEQAQDRAEGSEAARERDSSYSA